MPDEITIRPPSIKSEMVVTSPTITIRSYLSAQQLWAARHFARLAGQREDELAGRGAFDIQHRALVLVAIQSSVSFLEATINEIYQDAADGVKAYIEPLGDRACRLIREIWTSTEAVGRQIGTLDRYQFCLVASDKPALDRGMNPYQAANDVISLRNAVVHFKPTSRVPGELDKLGRRLEGKFSTNRLMQGMGNPTFPDHVLGAGCATWTVNSCVAFADAVLERLGLSPNYQRVRFPSD